MKGEDAIKTIFDAFVQRKDTYAEQLGIEYTRIPKELTEQDIIDHLNGKKTLGVYQFSKDNKLKWVCFDFDGKDLTEQLDLAVKLHEKLKKNGYNPLIEFSGRKGYHVWIFCKETDGTSAKHWATEIANGLDIHEIFPKQENIESGYGNLVKLPLGLHKLSGKRSFFFDDNFDEVEGPKAIELLKEKIKEPAVFPKVIIKETIRTITKPATKTPMPSYINYLVNNGAKEGDRHKGVFIITKELFNCGFKKEEILEQVTQFNDNCSPPKPHHLITNHVNYLIQYSEKYLAQEVTEDKSYEDMLNLQDISYNGVITTYKKWFYLNNVIAIDLALAVAISRKEKMQPLWIIMVAPSGSGKSELIRPFADEKQPSTTEIMSKITPNTFLSGMSKKKSQHTDFAETLENNPKLFLTYDFAQFAKLDSEQKAQIWAQLRDLYDGFIERKAYDVNKKVEHIKLNWLICTTPIIDSELLIHQELGTRELIYRFDPNETEKKVLMNTVWENSEVLEEMRKELKTVVRAFIEKKESNGLKKIKISKETKAEIEKLALTISVLRAATESDSYTGELTNFVYEEMPTRILLQLKDLFTALKNLDDGYSDEKAMNVLRKITLSSIHPIRLKILIELHKSAPLSTTDIQKRLSIGWKTVNTQLYTAKQLGLVDYTELDEEEGQIRNWKKKNWFLGEHEVNEYLNKLNLPT